MQIIKYNYNFISTGTTGDKIRNMGFKCQDVSEFTKFKELFDGRVKTLNPMIYSSLLYIRDNKNHKKQFLSFNFPEIDIVIVNLYPFKKYIKKRINQNNRNDRYRRPKLIKSCRKKF